MRTDQLELQVGERAGRVGAIYVEPPDAHTVYVMAHGAGANMEHAFMRTIAERLADNGVATLRYNFPYMELGGLSRSERSGQGAARPASHAAAGGKRPDPPAVLEATVRAAIEQGAELAAGRTLIAGGKSMGGRMTSQALSKRADERVRGIAFLGFPLHAPGRPGTDRAAHLAAVSVPMLFLQGTRDTLANLDLMKKVCAELGKLATLHVIDTADHSFAVLKRSGKTQEDVYGELAGAIREWTMV